MKMYIHLMMASLIVVALGCNQQDAAQNTSEETSVPASQYVAESEPTGAIPVGEARLAVKDGEDVTLVGLIGGSSEPFVQGLAAFTIVDAKVPFCAPEEGCPTPWDYCCTQDQVKDNIATIKIVDDAGKPLAQDARKLLNAKELSTVVVIGTAKRDEQGNLTVAASKVFVKNK